MAPKCNTPHLSITHWSFFIQFRITGYYDPGRLQHAGTQHKELSCWCVDFHFLFHYPPMQRRRYPPPRSSNHLPCAGGHSGGRWSPAGSRGRAPVVGVWGFRPQKLNNTRNINANFKWKYNPANKVTVKSTRKLFWLRIEVRPTALTTDLNLQSQSYGHDLYIHVQK